MTKRLFIKKEQEQLKCNPHVQAVSEKAITYTDEFKRHFISENEKGKLPREIFKEAGFGHFKDETNLKKCETLEEVKREIKSYMTYYNHYRGQWNLKKLPPVKYRQQLQQVVA